jgi:hypothetical protein
MAGGSWEWEWVAAGTAVALRAAVAGACVLALAGPAMAQTDYYNLDKQRPLRVEDAYAAERYVVEFQLSPLTLAGAAGTLRYTPSVEVKYGILPGMEVSAGVDAEVVRGGGSTTTSPGALELSALYNLNSETLGIPALAIRVTGHVPLDDGGGDVEFKGIVTRVLGGPWRVHVNGAAVFGGHATERWWAGLAIDHVLPFSSLLLLGETYYAEPRAADADGRVHTAVGLRYQLSPLTGIDAGVGTDWTGSDRRDWRLTFGVTRAMGFRPLMGLR